MHPLQVHACVSPSLWVHVGLCSPDEDHLTGSYLTLTSLLSDTLSDTRRFRKSSCSLSNRPKSMKKPGLRKRKPGQIVEAAGIAPASREALAVASTCVADHLFVGLRAPVGKVPFGLAHHEFNPSRNRRLSSGDPELASPAGSLGQRPGARPWLLFRQRDGTVQHCCWQVMVWSAFNEAC